MKLAFAIFRYFPFGGLQLDFARFLREGIRRGHSITVLYDRWEGDFFPGANYEHLKCSALTNWGRALEFERKAGTYFQSHPFDLIIGCNRMDGLDFYFAADNCFAAIARKKSWLERLVSPRCRVYERMERSIFGRSGKTVILYISELQKADYIKWYDTQENRFRYLPPGVDPGFHVRTDPERRQIRRRLCGDLKIGEEALLLVQVCSAFRTKGVDRVLNALGKLSGPLRSRVVYLIAGNDPRGEYRRRAERLGLGGQVFFLGARNDLPELLAACDLMVHPARNEAAGNVLAEAVSVGLPVVCTANCGYSPLVKDAGGVVLPEPYSDAALTYALELSLSLPDALDRMRSDALKYARTADFHHRTEAFWQYVEEGSHA